MSAEYVYIYMLSENVCLLCDFASKSVITSCRCSGTSVTLKFDDVVMLMHFLLVYLPKKGSLVL